MITPTNLPYQERELLSRIAQSDEAAFTEIFHQFSQRIWMFVVKKAKSESVAEEIVQEVFLKLWVKKEMATDIEDLASFLYTMAANKLYDHFKKVAGDSRKLENMWLQVQQAAISNPVEEALDFRESMHLINQAIEQLPPQRKKIYLLNRMEGLSYEEIAQKLNISKSTVSNQLVEATRSIREYIKSTGGATILFLVLSTKFYH
ncbi:MAG: RNA polymerase sigma factor [Niastella sp.]|jgi:RNA polymerase sigma-70 factor (family 1)|uniref:RNA polymerase sigma factor n=1 Tax=Niastella sp. TaxID=1869183 RepID=UPI00389ABB73